MNNLTSNYEQQLKILISNYSLNTSSIDEMSLFEIIKPSIPLIAPDILKTIVIEIRSINRYISLAVCREMATITTHKYLVSSIIESIIYNLDDILEYLNIYWKSSTPKTEPISMQSRKGLQKAACKLDESKLTLSKLTSVNSKFTLKDFFKLIHPKPKTQYQAELWKQLIRK